MTGNAAADDAPKVRDMFGNLLTIEQARVVAKRKGTQPKGYAALPGSGPAGETCKSCRHIVRKRMAKTYLKCGLMERSWTGGTGSDIRACAPACSRWEKPE
jgi:hypothetical protein